MTRSLKYLGLLACLWLCLVSFVQAQTSSLRGSVMDPSGAMVPDASVTLNGNGRILTTVSDREGRYAFAGLAAGTYALTASAPGFAQISVPAVAIAAGQTRELVLHLVIAVEKQQVTVQSQTQSIGVGQDQNVSATILSGSALNALSDDPTELQNELQALAGPAAGPNGGQIYIDGFEGGQLPPKSDILEIRVNQNPFSAENERIGYGRIDILTKPGSQKVTGQVGSFGTDSPFNAMNPLVTTQPSYYLYGVWGSVSGPLTKHASYFFNGFGMDLQNQAIIDAVNPQNLSQNFSEAFPTPSNTLVFSPRVDFQLGINTITVRDSIFHASSTSQGVGTLNLPQQAYNSVSAENTLQVGDTILVNAHLVNETHFQWRRIRNSQTPSYTTPAITLEGAFTTGGNSSGVSQDHEDDLELQNYSTATAGTHTLRFGTRLLSYRDANYSIAGANGSYFFASTAQYQASKPEQYQATIISNPLARALVWDGALFFEDDWRVTPNFDMGLGLRFEGQNRIHDHAAWAPRLSLAWSPHHKGSSPAKTVVRAGYGWFYNPFTVANFFGNASAAPYVIQTIHNNLINQRSYVVNNPAFYNPNAAEPASVVESASGTAPNENTIDPHFHLALDMQAGVGVDRQIAKGVMANVTYLYTQGVHQYFTDIANAPAFDPSTYTITGTPPSVYNYQYQSGGVYKESQLIFTTSVRWKKLGLNGNYTFTQANSDTQGVNSFPSVPDDPGLDYGRATFSIRHKMFLIGTYAAPYGITAAAMIMAQSGTPFNVTIGQDYTGDNQFNARPTYGVCGAPSVVSTQYGCLDTDPVGTGERMIPMDVGTGPANANLIMRVSRVIGVGPRVKPKGSGWSFHPGGSSVSGRGLSGGGAAVRLDAEVPRKYSLSFSLSAINVLNTVNLAPPDGVLNSPRFGQSLALAPGQFSPPVPGNRVIFFESTFAF